MKGVPKTAEEASALLSRAERLLRSNVANGPLLELTRFLGANSHAWTPTNRARLRRLLASLGAEAVNAVVATIHGHPRSDVLDEAELVLRQLPAEAIGRMGRLVADQSLLPGARACLLRAAARTAGMGASEVLHTALNDPEPELRDGAASLLAELGIPNARPMLQRRLAREANVMVRGSIREALASLDE